MALRVGLQETETSEHAQAARGGWVKQADDLDAKRLGGLLRLAVLQEIRPAVQDRTPGHGPHRREAVGPGRLRAAVRVDPTARGTRR